MMSTVSRCGWEAGFLWWSTSEWLVPGRFLVEIFLVDVLLERMEEVFTTTTHVMTRVATRHLRLLASGNLVATYRACGMWQPIMKQYRIYTGYSLK